MRNGVSPQNRKEGGSEDGSGGSVQGAAIRVIEGAGNLKMAWRRSIQAAVRELRRQEANLQRQLSEVEAKIKDLEALSNDPDALQSAVRVRSPTRRLSPEGKAAISRAAKKRWAQYRRSQATGGGSGGGVTKRTTRSKRRKRS